MDKSIYVHFHPDERPFVDKASEWIERSARQHAVKRTDFLDPRQASILQVLANKTGGVNLRLDGGYEGAERRRAIIVPEYREPEEVDAGILILAITPDAGNRQTLEHGDYMGSILALGMKRDKIGDIRVNDKGCHCLVAGEAADYLHLQLQKVNRVNVLTELLPVERLETADVSLEEMSLSVASLRLDGIVSDVCRLSRAKALAPIKAGRCRVNWKVEEDPGKPLKEGDVVSLQGFGRFKLLEVEGVTKKGRIRLTVGVFK